MLTWGCQMNLHDSEVISGVVEKIGYCPAESVEEADLIILNTCSVRENAERKVYGRIAQLKEYKRRNPNLVIAITGCMIQQPHVREHISKHLPYVDVIFGIHNVYKLPELIDNARQVNMPLIEVFHDTSINENLPIKRENSSKAWITIAYGCNNFCSYCIVPYVRGREKSRNPEDIIKEIKDLAQQGCLEVNLLGQNVNSYGKDLEPPFSFPQLLRKINEIPGLSRIRFLTSHPKDLSDELIGAIKDCEKVCEHIHLPVQAGSNKILKQMNRKYTREHYMELINKLRKAVPEIAVTTDIIVGFPGETEQDFEDTLDLVKQVEFDSAFTFIYSKREGTPAAKMEDQVEEEIKKDRLNRLMELQDEITMKKNLHLEDKTVEVLVEGISKGNKGRLSGRTRTNKLVNFEGPEILIGKLVNVKITEPHNWSLMGKIEE